jgi:hypothetical protein
MKKLSVVVLVIVMVLAVSACGATPNNSASQGENTSNTQDSTPLSDTEIVAMLTNANDFKGRAVEGLPGVVFNVMSQTEGDYEYQCWADEESEYSFIIISETNLDLAVDDNIFVNGIVLEKYSGTNAFGGSVEAPVIIVTSVDKSDSSIFNLASDTIEINQTQEQKGISVTLQKVELANKSTRVFLTVSNESKDKISVYTFESYIKQGKSQFDSSDISYTEDTLQTDINVGIESSGILSFQKINSLDEPFTISIDVSSDDWDVKLKPFVFDVTR